MAINRNESSVATTSELKSFAVVSSIPTSSSTGSKYSNDQVTGASDLTTRQSLRPLALMCLSAVLLGITTGVSMGQTKAFQNALGVSRGTVSWIEIGYFAPFFIMPLTLGMFLARRVGYRKAMGVAFILCGAGHAGYWPASVTQWFPGFCLSAFVTGTGVSCGLAAKIPYCASCGPKRNSEMRTLVLNTLYSVAILLGQLISVFALYKDKRVELGAGDIAPIRWAHVSCAAVDIALALLFFSVRIPEITDADMEADAASKAAQTGWTARPLRQQRLFWAGCISVFFYDGAQVSFSAFFVQFLQEVLPTITDRRAASMLLGVVALTILSKSGTSVLLRGVRPRIIVAAAFAVSTACLGVAIAAGGPASAAFAVLQGFARAPLGILVHTMALRGLGRHTKLGGALLTSMSGGAAVMVPFAAYLSEHIPLRIAMVVPLGASVLASSFAVYVNTAQAKKLDLLRVAEKKQREDERESSSCWFRLGRNARRNEGDQEK